jgi:hypothetical protein
MHHTGNTLANALHDRSSGQAELHFACQREPRGIAPVMLDREEGSDGQAAAQMGQTSRYYSRAAPHVNRRASRSARIGGFMQAKQLIRQT